MKKRKENKHLFLGLLLVGSIMLTGCAKEQAVNAGSKDYQQSEKASNADVVLEEDVVNIPEQDETADIHMEAEKTQNEMPADTQNEVADEIQNEMPTDTQNEVTVETQSLDTLGNIEADVEEMVEDVNEGLELPISLDSGKLSIDSFFQMDGFNPDCKNTEGSGIAAIVLKNESEEYLAKAELVLSLSDGQKIKYEICDLPSGKDTMAFSIDHLSVASDVKCLDIACEAVYKENQTEAFEKVSVSVDGIDVLVTNISGQSISRVTLYCHNLLDEEYFGGTSYVYTINNLAADESAVIQAVDCILGMAEVVLVEIE